MLQALTIVSDSGICICVARFRGIRGMTKAIGTGYSGLQGWSALQEHYDIVRGRHGPDNHHAIKQGIEEKFHRSVLPCVVQKTPPSFFYHLSLWSTKSEQQSGNLDPFLHGILIYHVVLSRITPCSRLIVLVTDHCSWRDVVITLLNLRTHAASFVSAY